jgi:hypothetical protein
MITSPFSRKRTIASALKGVVHWINCSIFKTKSIKVPISQLNVNFTLDCPTIFSNNLIKYGCWEASLSNYIYKYNTVNEKVFLLI